jgi:hypothetical protein
MRNVEINCFLLMYMRSASVYVEMGNTIFNGLYIGTHC